MLADEFNDIPIMPQINITNSTTTKIRFITVFAPARSLLQAAESPLGTRYCLLMVHETIKHSRFQANKRFNPQLECRHAPQVGRDAV